MKLEYIKPDLEELELVLEGSFLKTSSDNNEVGGEIGEGPGGGDEGDDWD